MVPASSHKVSRVPWYSGYCSARFRFHLRGFHPLRPVFPVPFRYLNACFVQSIPRNARHSGLGLSGFARRYSRNRVFFLFLRLLRCFSSPGSPCMAMDSPCSDRGLLCRVSPFGYPRICACMQLPAAFRSLPRPSSASGAKASAPCLLLLNHKHSSHLALFMPGMCCMLFLPFSRLAWRYFGNFVLPSPFQVPGMACFSAHLLFLGCRFYLVLQTFDNYGWSRHFHPSGFGFSIRFSRYNLTDGLSVIRKQNQFVILLSNHW